MKRRLDEIQMSEGEQVLDAVVSVREVLNLIESDRYLSLTEAAKYLSVSTRTIRDRLDEIPHRRVGTRILLFKKSELDAWLDQYREGGKAELDELVNETLAKVI